MIIYVHALTHTKKINESLDPFGRYWPMGLSPAFPLPYNDVWAFFLYFFLYDTWDPPGLFLFSPNSSFVRLLGITAVAWKFIRRPPSTPPLQRTRTQASLYPRLPDPCAPNADAPPDTDRRARPRPAAPAEPNRQELSPMRPFFLCVMELQCVSYFLSP